jgi:hypothetical protein
VLGGRCKFIYLSCSAFRDTQIYEKAAHLASMETLCKRAPSPRNHNCGSRNLWGAPWDCPVQLWTLGAICLQQGTVASSVFWPRAKRSVSCICCRALVHRRNPEIALTIVSTFELALSKRGLEYLAVHFSTPSRVRVSRVYGVYESGVFTCRGTP